LQIVAFEISAKNRKNRENNKWKQARSKKINRLCKASNFISQIVSCATATDIATWHDHAQWARQMKKPGAAPGLAHTFNSLCFLAQLS
jgi:hypothetical protein